MINVSKLYCGLGGQSDDLRYRRDRVVGPVVAYNCTRRCNLRCLHCYSASDSGCGEREMTTDQAKRFLGQLKDAQVPVCLFSGGEPLLRPDLFDLLDEAKRIGLPTVISTNGTQIDSEVARRLRDASLRYVGISLDGQEPFHDQFRQVQGSFRAALTGIEHCRKAGLRTGLRFTITQANADQVPAVFDIARDIGVRRICFYHLVRTGRAAQAPLLGSREGLEKGRSGPDSSTKSLGSISLKNGKAESLDARPESGREKSNRRFFPPQVGPICLSPIPVTSHGTRSVLDTIFDRTREFVEQGLVDEVLTVGNHADGPYLLVRMQRENHPGFEQARELLLANGGNRVGDKIACVAWDGTVYPDQFWRNYPLGDVTERPFHEIWSNTADPVLARLRNKDTHADPRCLKCRWFRLCKGNYRFLDSDPADASWRNEPACYLMDEETGVLHTDSAPMTR